MAEENIVHEVAKNLGMETEEVFSVIDEFFLQLHRRSYEYVGINGDYIGEELHWQIGPQAFYHLLGFLSHFSESYNWDVGSANEYLARLGNRDWLPYCHQTEGWVSAARRREEGAK